MLLWFFIAFIAIVSIQTLFYSTFIISSFLNHKQKSSSPVPVSVIICAKNEEKNIEKFLPSIFSQNYNSDFEVVLINDRSTDETGAIFEKYAQKYNNVKIVTVNDCENFWGNKKYALTLGIKAAKYEHLLFTDADCTPTSNNWITEMASSFSTSKQIVLGYGAYRKIKSSLLNKLIRFETLATAMQYFSYARVGNPYMGVGRNLAYTKSEFFKVNGFIKHIKTKSGDDDLFINEVANKTNTSTVLSKDGFTISEPKTTFKDWFSQKRRHISTANHYKKIDAFLLAIYYFSQLSFWLLSPLLLTFQFNIEITEALIGFRFLINYLAIGLYAKKLDEKDLIILAPIIEITLIFIQLFLFIRNKISKPTHW